MRSTAKHWIIGEKPSVLYLVGVKRQKDVLGELGRVAVGEKLLVDLAKLLCR